MKNREKFAKEIMDIACSGHGVAFDKKANKVTECNNTHCSNCAFCTNSSGSCRDKIKEWCESEYKEPEVDWSKVPVDTPVLVKDYERKTWYNRYFAYYKDGKVFVYTNGATSWSKSTNNATTFWDYAKLANEEDIRKYAR